MKTSPIVEKILENPVLAADQIAEAFIAGKQTAVVFVQALQSAINRGIPEEESGKAPAKSSAASGTGFFSWRTAGGFKAVGFWLIVVPVFFLACRISLGVLTVISVVDSETASALFCMIGGLALVIGAIWLYFSRQGKKKGRAKKGV